MKLKSFLSILPLLFLIGCSNSGTETGNPGVTLILSDFDTRSFSKMGGVGPLAVTEVTMCFKRLRFKTEDETNNIDSNQDEDSVDLSLGQVTLQPNGEELVTVQVPPGEYTRIEFDLEKDCLNQAAPSLIVNNDNLGSPFQTEDRITIKFEGLVVVSGDIRLDLAVGNIIDALGAVTDGNDIKAILEDPANWGSYTNADDSRIRLP